MDVALKGTSTTIISDTEPTEECMLWLKPTGGTTISDTIFGSSGTPIISLMGVHVGNEPPENKDAFWIKPVSE